MPRKKNPVTVKFQKIIADKEVVRPTYKHPMMVPRKMPDLVVFLDKPENKGRSTTELIKEFRETCGHDLKEIAFLIKEGRRHTYQVCQICNLFVTANKAY
jgi:hypothetical protein